MRAVSLGNWRSVLVPAPMVLMTMDVLLDLTTKNNGFWMSVNQHNFIH